MLTWMPWYALHALQIAMFEAWWDGGRRLKLPRNQPYLNSLRGTAYGLCYDATSCAALTRHKQPGKHGKAAVVLHPTQFSDYDKCPWRRPLFDEHGRSLCEPRFLFLHLICLAGAEKEGFMRSYGLWLVDERGLPLTGAGAGVYNAPGARSGLLAGAGAGLGHLGLPCGSRMAWSNRELWAHHLHVVWSEEFAANMNRSRVA